MEFVSASLLLLLIVAWLFCRCWCCDGLGLVVDGWWIESASIREDSTSAFSWLGGRSGLLWRRCWVAVESRFRLASREFSAAEFYWNWKLRNCQYLKWVLYSILLRHYLNIIYNRLYQKQVINNKLRIRYCYCSYRLLVENKKLLKYLYMLLYGADT